MHTPYADGPRMLLHMRKLKMSLKIPKGNQKPYIEGQTIQWPNEKGQTTIYKTLHRKQKI